MRSIPLVVLCLALSGCAGLSVNWELRATYTSEVPLGGRK